MNFVYDPVQAAQLTDWVQFVSPVKGVRDELSTWAATPPRWPTARSCSRATRTRPRLHVFADLPDEIDVAITERFLGDHRRLTDGRRRPPPTTAALRAGRKIPYRLILPGMLFTFVFFVVPLITLLKISLSTKPDRLLPELRVHVGVEQLLAPPSPTSARNWCGPSPTPASPRVLCLLIAYPVAYFIAFKAGPYRNVLLGLVMVPFFTSFLLRTIAWQSLLNDNGPVMGVIEALQPRRAPRAHRHHSTTAGC